MSSESLLGAEAESAASAYALPPNAQQDEAAVQWAEQHAGSGGDGEETKTNVRSGGGVGGGVGGGGGSSGGRGFGGGTGSAGGGGVGYDAKEELFEQEMSRWQKMHDPDNQRGNNVIYIWVHNIAKVRVHGSCACGRVPLDRVHLIVC